MDSLFRTCSVLFVRDLFPRCYACVASLFLEAIMRCALPLCKLLYVVLCPAVTQFNLHEQDGEERALATNCECLGVVQGEGVPPDRKRSSRGR